MIIHKTKIVCSIGPASGTDEIVRNLIKKGMNVARFNFSHGTHETHKIAMDRVKRISQELKTPVALLLDTKGPEIRTGMTRGGKNIDITAGDKFIVTADGSECFAADGSKPGNISLSWKDAPDRIKKGHKILIADGLIELDADSVSGAKIFCTAHNAGSIGSRKNVNIIGVHAGLPIMSEQDKQDIAFGVEQNIDFIAASFVSFPEEVVQIREYLTELGSKARIISKIENEEGVENIDRILEESDGIMVARGDLGVQIPTERIPLIQKKIIRQCRIAGKPVITATQMLDSMIYNPRPTRAELTDVANAVFDGTDAVMLSGETAGGKYPVESVETMAKIVKTTEKSEEYKKRMMETDAAFDLGKDTNRLISKSAFRLATNINAKVIITPTLRGNTARLISKFRPEQPVIAVTPDSQVERQLLLNWGVYPFACDIASDSEEMIQKSIKIAIDNKFVEMSDQAVMLAGIPLHGPNAVNTIKIINIGNVLAAGTVCGHSSNESPLAFGRILKAEDPQSAAGYLKTVKSPVLVCWRITEAFIPILRLVNGVIAEAGSDLSDEMLSSVNKNLVWLTDVTDARKILEEGLSVTLDGSQGLIYEGTV